MDKTDAVKKLCIPLHDRFMQGRFPQLENLEDALSLKEYCAVIDLMNQAFDAGQVEILKAAKR